MFTGYYTPLHGPCEWDETAAANRGIPSPLGPNDSVLRCRTLVLNNGDLAHVGKYIVYRTGSPSATLAVGRVEEILVEDQTSRLLGVLVSWCTIGPDLSPYSLPSCKVDPARCLLLVFQVSLPQNRDF